MKVFKLSLLLCSVFLIGLSCSNSPQYSAKSQKVETQYDSVSYSLGVDIGTDLVKRLTQQQLDTFCNDLLIKGFHDAILKSELDIASDNVRPVLQRYFEARSKVQNQEFIEASENFLTENKAKDGVVELPSGLQYKILKEGTGEKPSASDKVTVHYHGTLIDGTVFDSSVERGKPTSFPVNGVIKGWTEALQLMPVGSKWQLYIPHQLAYGERGSGNRIKPFSTLIFDVELISIDK